MRGDGITQFQIFCGELAHAFAQPRFAGNHLRPMVVAKMRVGPTERIVLLSELPA